MFYKKRIDAIADKVIDMDTDIKALKNAISKNIKDMEALNTMQKGLLEALKGDRKDINAIIAIVKKLQNKRVNK